MNIIKNFKKTETPKTRINKVGQTVKNTAAEMKGKAQAAISPSKPKTHRGGLEVSINWNGKPLFHAKADTTYKVAKKVRH